MFVTLKSEKFTAVISTHGAELCSVKDNNGKEYIWQADEKVWKRHAPVLFPIVGKVRGNKYTIDGKEYQMGQHGIARDQEFEILEHNDTMAIFELKANDITKEKYPYDFSLKITYELKDSTIKVIWTVTNTDDKKISFSIGAHPAFIGMEDNLANGKLYFNVKEDKLTYELLNEDGLLGDDKDVLALDNGCAKLNKEFFDRDALIFEHLDCNEVALYDNNDDRIVSVKFDAPLFGIWSAKCTGVPYVCIEPWYGRADRADFDKSFDEREYGNSLEINEVFEKSYTMEFGNNA